MFTMPWSSTRAFPHPLANLRKVGIDPRLENYISYSVVEWLTWQGLGDPVNKWRRSIDLEEVAMFDAPMLTQMLKIPFTSCWSPALVPKPADLASHIGLTSPRDKYVPRLPLRTKHRRLWILLSRRSSILSTSRSCPVSRGRSAASLHRLR